MAGYIIIQAFAGVGNSISNSSFTIQYSAQPSRSQAKDIFIRRKVAVDFPRLVRHHCLGCEGHQEDLHERTDSQGLNGIDI